MSLLGDIASGGLELSWITGRDRSVLQHMADCRSGRLGGNVLVCSCGNRDVHYNSCRDRHCPVCQGAARARWVRARLDELLPTAYFHVVFTVPHELLPLALANRRWFYSALFHCAHQTLLAVCATAGNLGGRVGGLSILHTWNQKLAFHPHLHCIVPGGGVSPDGRQWIPGNPNYLVSVRRLSAVFRGKLLGQLETTVMRGELHGGQSTLLAALRKAAGQAFVVYAKPPFGGPAQVVKYLGRYTHRVGISEQRIVSFRNQRVCFSWIDRAHGHCRKLLSLSQEDFIARFMLHILPKALRKIRYFGYMANRDRQASIATVRQLIAASSGCPEVTETSGQVAAHDSMAVQQADPPPVEPGWTTCPRCGEPMSVQCSWSAGAPGDLRSRLARERAGQLGRHGPEPNRVVPA
jgi:hypothetical protein